MNTIISSEKTRYHAEILSNRACKMYAHFRKRYAKQKIDCYRLYDWDIPEVRAVVDYYAGHLVIGEYVRKQTPEGWLSVMAQRLGQDLGVPMEKIHIKERRTSTKKEPRYRRLDQKDHRLIVNERDLKFFVNLNDFLDTGLYSDHRETRLMVRALAKGQDFLNLYCYTGAFTCAAVLGGAKTTVSVDRSATYLKWTQENLQLNHLMGTKNYLVKSDVLKYLSRAQRKGDKFSLAVIDPPSFFRDRKSGKSFDINVDHPQLISEVIKIMKPNGIIFFSTNHQRFEPKMHHLKVSDLKEITKKTVPEDYRNKNIHRCWKMVV